MNILFIGDVCGKPGRRILKSSLSSLIKKTKAEVVIVNGENAAHGKGITPKIYQEFIRLGVHCVTLGNHAFAKSEIKQEIDCLDRLIRPENMTPSDLGKSSIQLMTSEGILRILNISGEAFMDNITESPFDTMKQYINRDEMLFVDFHGETTGEKLTFFHTYKMNCVGIVGTHTHVTTSDETVDSGCGYISDVGMTGVIHSILGRDINEVIRRQNGEKTHYTVATGEAMLNAVLLTVVNRRCEHIERIKVIENQKQDLEYIVFSERFI